jgi:hypothetical protein
MKWKETTESKRLGALLATLSAMEQELLSTYPNFDQKELRTAKAWLLLAQCRLERSTPS